MKINPPFLEVKPAEQLTITITPIGTDYRAVEDDNISPASWVSRTGPVRTDDGSPRVLVLKPPASGDFPVVLHFTFIPDLTGAIPAGTQYNVTIVGDPAEDTRSRTFTPPPNDQAWQIVFSVVAGATAEVGVSS